MKITLIEHEIARLESKSRESETGLSLEDVKKLKLLIESGQLLLTHPVVREEPSKAVELTDEQLDELAKPKDE